jgi:hypothetical protein
MRRLAALLVVAAVLAGCDVVDTLTDGLQHANAVREKLEASTGIRPEVGFKWHNIFLESVTVTFPTLYEKSPLGELAETVRRAVTSEFKQTPTEIVLAFTLPKTGSGKTALLQVR